MNAHGVILKSALWECKCHVQARNLPAADFGFTGKGSSDPYVVIKIGSSSFQTSCQVKTLNPVWGPAHSCDLLVYHMEQHVFVEVWDSDLVTADDLLGHVEKGGKRPTVADFVEKSETERWWTLETEEKMEIQPEVKLRTSTWFGVKYGLFQQTYPQQERPDFNQF